jgi:Carboxypeptidase regulatory-like domain
MRNAGAGTMDKPNSTPKGTREASFRFPQSRIALISLTLFAFGHIQAAAPIRFAGAVSGMVTDSAGRPQPGAAVVLLNQQERLLQKVYTDLSGNFSFGDLLPDLYSVQVSMTSFVTASRQKVPVKPGMRSLLEVSLSRMFSSIQVVSTVPTPGGLMSDDWKWTLRADAALRPVLRLLPEAAGSATASSTTASSGSATSASGVAGTSGTRAAIFHDSSALVRISATDSALTDAAANEADMGTQFAFATSLYNRSQVQVSGDLGYASTTGQPAAAIRTTFSHEIAWDNMPSVSFTMRQMSAATHVGQSMMGGPAGEGSLPTLRTLSLSMNDKAKLSDALSIQYGSELDTISFLNRMQYFSPWAKVTYATPHGHLDIVFTSGNAQPGLSRDADYRNDGLQGELAALSMLPRLSENNGQVKVQRGDNYEIGYSAISGAMEYRVSGYHEYVSNSTLTIANPDANLFSGDLLPSMFASSALFDEGTISSSGYTVSATRTLNQNHRITVAYGTLGVMTPETDRPIRDAENLRQAMTAANRGAATIRSEGLLKKTGTRYVASYQYADLKTAVPMANYSTQPDRAEPGLNIAIRQPIPFFGGMAGHVEATAEMRNLLAQGYLPLELADGRQILIVNSPRVFRGGLAFIF